MLDSCFILVCDTTAVHMHNPTGDRAHTHQFLMEFLHLQTTDPASLDFYVKPQAIHDTVKPTFNINDR